MKQAALTPKQEAFALEYFLNGRNATAAYKKVYNTKASDQVIWGDSHKVLHTPKVAVRIKQLRMASYSKDVLTIDERKRLLSEFSLQGDIKSIDLLNKMENVYGDGDEAAGTYTFTKA